MATNGNPGELTPRQRRAIAALLQARNAAEAAGLAGIGKRTLYRWMLDPAFRAELTRAEAETIDAAGRRLLAGQDAALDVLSGMMADPNATDANKRQAAQAWLDHTLRWRELRNVEERLTELEAAVYANKPN